MKIRIPKFLMRKGTRIKIGQKPVPGEAAESIDLKKKTTN